MATNYPGSLDSGTEQPSPLAATEMDDAGFEHDVVHTNHSGAIIALETKVGTGDSNAVINSVLAGTGSGTSGWTTGTLANAISGNAATATALATARAINGVNFDGSAAITVTAAAGTLTGATLASGVTASSLTSVGTLTALTMGATSTSEGGEIRLDGGTSYAANYARIDRYGDNLLRFMDQSAVRMSLDITNGNLVVTGDATTTTTRGTTAFYVGSSGDDGIGPVTGQFGNVQTVGSGVGNYEGYSISGRAVFMHDGGSATGLYNDVNNQWILFSSHGAATDIRYAGAAKVTTSSTGATITGSLAVTTNATITGQLNCSHIRGDETTQYFGPSTSWEMYLNTSGLYPYTDNGSALGSTSKYWNGVYSKNWFRSHGSTGWYNQTYGGGWYMTDSTWVRAYNGKGILTTGKIYLGAMTTFTSGGYATARRKDSTGYFMELVSSERFKTNITDLDLAEASKILDARPIKYQDIVEAAEDPDSPYQVGLSAESLHEAGYPWVLKYDYDEETKITDFTKPRGIHYEFLVAPLIAIVKDLKTRLAAVEAAL